MNNRNSQPNLVWFSLALIIIAIIQLTHFLAFAGVSITWMAVFFVHSAPTYYLLGPFIFFYIRGTLKDQSRLRWTDAWHFIPFVTLLIGILPYTFKPWAFKLEAAELLIKDVHYMVKAEGLVLYPVIVNIILRPITWIGYTAYSLYLVLQFKRHYPNKGRIQFKDAKQILRFMIAFLIICLLTVLSFTALSVEYFLNFDKPTMEFINTPWIWTVSLGVALIPFMIVLYPEILYGIPRMRVPEDEIKEVDSEELGSEKKVAVAIREPEKLAEEGEKYSNQVSDFKELAAQIIKVIETQKPYLHPDFSPDYLAAMMEVPKHHLYYCFNKILNTRFTRLRAEYRVRHAQQLIENGETSQKTLEAIGLESGFANRISFNKAFREVTGTSPTEFLRKQSN